MYNDLLGRGDGTPEGFIAAYFELMGWPEMMATSDRAMFLKKVRSVRKAAVRVHLYLLLFSLFNTSAH